MKMMMKQMGMSQDTIDAAQVIIKTQDGKSYVFDNPQVEKITMQGQSSFQIQGGFEIVEEEVVVEISEDDVKTVMEQANVSEEEAKDALEKFNGDLAEAIVNLTE